MRHVSAFPGQEEVLFPPNPQFKVDRVVTSGQGHVTQQTHRLGSAGPRRLCHHASRRVPQKVSLQDVTQDSQPSWACGVLVQRSSRSCARQSRRHRGGAPAFALCWRCACLRCARLRLPYSRCVYLLCVHWLCMLSLCALALPMLALIVSHRQRKIVELAR